MTIEAASFSSTKMLRTTRIVRVGGTTYAAGADVPARSFAADVLARLVAEGALVRPPRRRRVREPFATRRLATPGEALHRCRGVELVPRPPSRATS